MSATVTLPPLLETRLSTLADTLQGNLVDNLISLTLYGSAARGLYQPGVSDVNLLIVLAHADREALKRVRHSLQTADGDVCFAPYLVTERELPHLVHAFPTRVLEMKRGYAVLTGRDVLSGLTVDSAALTTRCGQELLNLLLRFRHRLLGSEDPAAMEALMHPMLASFLKILRTLIYLRTGEHIDDRERLIEVGAEPFKLPRRAFQQLLAWRREQVVLSAEDWPQAVDCFFEGLQNLAKALDG